MKKVLKILLIAVLLASCLLIFAGCERKTGNRITSGRDVQTFTYAWVNLGGKDIVEGFVTQWRDYDNSDTVQVLVNGKFYLTHYTNVVLEADPAQGSLAYSDAEWFGINE